MTKLTSLALRILCVALCFACLCSALQPMAVSAEAAEAAPQRSMTTKVHNAPYTDAVVIGQMEQGTYVTVLGQSGSFYKVDCYDMVGYIAKSQISRDTNKEYYVTCQPDSEETDYVTYENYEDALELRSSLLDLAKRQLGKPYIYGSTGPRGFDCSGLMFYLYGNHDISLHRTASQQLQDGIIVAKEGLQVGDLIFTREAWESYPASHVGIYVGDNQVIHASNRGIACDDLYGPYFGDNYLCARRIVNTKTADVGEVNSAITVANVMTRTAGAGRRTSN